MNLQRHHILYGLLAVALMIALIVLLMPRTPHIPSTAPTATSTSATTTAQAQSITPMQFEVVTTEADQERGLGGRASIPENYGMLFVFAQSARVGFWMKDMLTPIDMIWLSDSGTILGIEDSVSPDTYPEAFYPPSPVRYVLETRAGEAQRRGWSVGSQVDLPAPY